MSLFIVIVMIFKAVSRNYMECKKSDDYFDGELYVFGMIGLFTVGIIFALISVGYLSGVIEWAVTPDAMAVRYILELVR